MTRFANQQAAYGLCLSAVRLRLARGWVDPERHARAFASYDDQLVRAVAETHGQLGERKDAEGWVLGLADPRKRAWALLGLAQGLLARER